MTSFSVRKVANGWTVDTYGPKGDERFVAYTVDEVLGLLRRNMEDTPVLTAVEPVIGIGAGGVR